MNLNSIRFDLSDWLIHFFRDIDLESSNSIPYIEYMGWDNVIEDTHYSALFMLRCAIRSGRLWATWSYRNNIRTIYGPHPAVCFTEMPIAAFLESSETRYEKGEAMSQFALIFPKNEMVSAGANPVMYGLDDKNYRLPSGQNGEARIIDSQVFPEREQYRYVTFNPASSRPIDWSHEREWRWPYRGDYSSVENEIEEFGVIEDSMNIPGFDFYNENISGIGVIVKNQIQAQWIAHDILTLVDKKIIHETTFGFILVAENLPSSKYLIDPINTKNAIIGSLIDLSPYFSYNKNELASIAKDFSNLVAQVENEESPAEYGACGGCWLWILDNTSILVRALIQEDRIIVNESGKYLVDLYEFSDSRCLDQRENMTQKLASLIYKKYGNECGYFSVSGSDDPDEVPFYNSDHMDNHMHYNLSWEY